MSLFQVTKKQVIENYELRTMTGDIVSFTPSYSQLLPDPFSDLNVTVNVLATGGNGTPDNPNPIVGYSSTNITRCGVNLWDKTHIFEGYINDTNGNYSANANYKCTDYIPVKGGLDYYIKSDQSGSNWGAWYDSEKNYIKGLNSFANRVKTAPSNACFARLTIWASGSGDVDTFGFNYPETDTTYHAYNGQTYTIAFGQTVYGGVLDVTRGKLKVTHGYKDLGTLNYTMYTVAQGNLFRTDEFDIKKVTTTVEVPDIISSQFIAVASANRTNYTISMANNTARIDVIDDDYSDADVFKSAMSGVQLVYLLATPFDIDLTPVQIRALVGENNVFADCGQSTVTCLI